MEVRSTVIEAPIAREHPVSSAILLDQATNSVGMLFSKVIEKDGVAVAQAQEVLREFVGLFAQIGALVDAPEEQKLFFALLHGALERSKSEGERISEAQLTQYMGSLSEAVASPEWTMDQTAERFLTHQGRVQEAIARKDLPTRTQLLTDALALEAKRMQEETGYPADKYIVQWLDNATKMDLGNSGEDYMLLYPLVLLKAAILASDNEVRDDRSRALSYVLPYQRLLVMLMDKERMPIQDANILRAYAMLTEIAGRADLTPSEDFDWSHLRITPRDITYDWVMRKLMLPLEKLLQEGNDYTLQQLDGIPWVKCGSILMAHIKFGNQSVMIVYGNDNKHIINFRRFDASGKVIPSLSISLLTDETKRDLTAMWGDWVDDGNPLLRLRGRIIQEKIPNPILAGVAPLAVES